MVDDVTRDLLGAPGTAVPSRSILGLVRAGTTRSRFVRIGSRPRLSGFVTDLAGVSVAMLRERARSA